MLDVFQVARRLVDHAVQTHGAAVSLIAYYGSHATGEASAHSDLDIFYTPVDGANPPLARQFLVAGIPFDFWPISWESLAQFATGTLRGWAVAPGIVRNARLLYARSDADRERFHNIQQQVVELEQPQARPQMLRRALEAFPEVLIHLGNLRLACADGDIASIRVAGWNVVTTAVECLALVNQTTFPRGWGYLLEQLPLLALRPENSEALITGIATAADPAQITAAAEELAAGTRRILRRQQEAFPPEAATADVFGDGYPEIREHIAKVLSHCERQRPVAASFEACSLQDEIARMLASTGEELAPVRANLYAEYAGRYRELGFPNLMENTASPDSGTLAAQARLFDARLRHWLQANSLSLHQYDTLEAFEESLK